MCTTIKYHGCMGRNFDYEISYNETIRFYGKEQYKMIGVATGIVKDYPLYYDAMNEHGLCMAGLNFEGNAYYYDEKNVTKKNFAPWELIPKILGVCKNVEDAKEYLTNVRLINKQFNEKMPNTPLHWFICDKESSITVEQTKDDGLKIYDNSYNVLTNNPPFSKMEKYIEIAKKRFKESNYLFPKILPKVYKTRGLETYGLTGDLTSMGRFGRINFYKDKLNNVKDKFDNVIQTFHLLDSVKQIYAATPINDKFEYTIYEVVYDIDNLEVYWKLYDDLDVKKFDFNSMLQELNSS